ncbi:MAG: DUF6062 family protein [Oscillospiraceae bacterium]|nr:DUF6062 family protein [Oscillospiraceae bacterium]
MKEAIYTVPINEAYGSPEGCPLCALRAHSESSGIEFALGASVMEPDVRIQVNEQGFCAAHLGALLEKKNRLGLSLMLESLYARLIAKGPSGLSSFPCYLCQRRDAHMGHFYANIVYMWKTEPDFRVRFAARANCLPHTANLLETARKLTSRKEYEAFLGEAAGSCLRQAEGLHRDLSAFCRSFDYRSAAQVLDEDTKKAAERAAAHLGAV